MNLINTDYITPRQQRCVVALISQPSVADAARKCGIGRSTIHRWLRDPKFKAALNAAERDVVSTVTSRLAALSQKAVEALEDVIEHGKKDADRTRAALGVLSNCLAWREHGEISEQLSRLEDETSVDYFSQD